MESHYTIQMQLVVTRYLVKTKYKHLKNIRLLTLYAIQGMYNFAIKNTFCDTIISKLLCAYRSGIPGCVFEYN